MFRLSKLVFWRKTKVEILSMAELVEKLDWAEKEVEETVTALDKLHGKLNEGLQTMESITKDAQSIIDRHQAILQKSVERKAEIGAQVDQIAQVVASVGAVKGATK